MGANSIGSKRPFQIDLAAGFWWLTADNFVQAY
jgi:hypothetical protein